VGAFAGFSAAAVIRDLIAAASIGIGIAGFIASLNMGSAYSRPVVFGLPCMVDFTLHASVSG